MYTHTHTQHLPTAISRAPDVRLRPCLPSKLSSSCTSSVVSDARLYKAGGILVWSVLVSVGETATRVVVRGTGTCVYASKRTCNHMLTAHTYVMVASLHMSLSFCTAESVAAVMNAWMCGACYECNTYHLGHPAPMIYYYLACSWAFWCHQPCFWAFYHQQPCSFL